MQTQQSILTEYLGPNLQPRTTYQWTVTVWDNRGKIATATARFENGLLQGTALGGQGLLDYPRLACGIHCLPSLYWNIHGQRIRGEGAVVHHSAGDV